MRYFDILCEHYQIYLTCISCELDVRHSDILCEQYLRYPNISCEQYVRYSDILCEHYLRYPERSCEHYHKKMEQTLTSQRFVQLLINFNNHYQSIFSKDKLSPAVHKYAYSLTFLFASVDNVVCTFQLQVLVMNLKIVRVAIGTFIPQTIRRNLCTNAPC